MQNPVTLRVTLDYLRQLFDADVPERDDLRRSIVELEANRPCSHLLSQLLRALGQVGEPHDDPLNAIVATG